MSNMKSKTFDGFSNYVITMGEPQREMIKVDFEEPLAVELKAFLARIHGDQSEDLVDSKDAREALRLAQAAIKPYEGSN